MRANIGEVLDLREGNIEFLDLTDATVNSFRDDARSWPLQLRIDGFTHGRIAEGPTDAKSRLTWLGRQQKFTPQPYLQFANVLEKMGDQDGAREVRIAMEDKVWDRKGGHRWTEPIVRWPLKAVGYGYDPLGAFWGVLGLSALGWVVYRRSYLAGTMVPVDKDAYKAVEDDGAL